MGELRTSNASSFVHDGQKPATKQRVVVICVARENVFDERHGFFRVVFHMFRKAFTLNFIDDEGFAQMMMENGESAR